MKSVLFVVGLVAGCGTDGGGGNSITGDTPTPKAESPTPTPTPTKSPEPAPEVEQTPEEMQLEERYLVRFYYVVEDEQVNKLTCQIKTVGLEMEFQYKNITKEKWDILSERAYCEVTDITEASETTGKRYEMRCDLRENYIWVDDTCQDGRSIQYKHYSRPQLDSWGTSAMPDPGYAYGGTSK